MPLASGAVARGLNAGGSTMLEHLTLWMSHLGHWGYLVVFIVVLLECQAVIGLFLPGESLVLLGGFLAGQGAFDPYILTAVIIAAAVVGDTIGYLVGLRLGQEWILKHGARFGLRQEHIDRVERFLERHGGKAIIGSRYMHLLRVLTPFMAGAHRMPYGRFLFYNTVGVVTWSALFVFLGHLAGNAWLRVSHWIGYGSEILLGAALVVGLGIWWWRRRRKAAGATPPADPRNRMEPG